MTELDIKKPEITFAAPALFVDHLPTRSQTQKNAWSGLGSPYFFSLYFLNKDVSFNIP